jgi:hypothetical protein
MVKRPQSVIAGLAAALLIGITAASDTGPLFLRGDCNRDGDRDIADPVTVLQYLFGSGTLACLDAADANDDGDVDIADPIVMLDYLFGTKDALPPPEAEPAVDPTPDELACGDAPEAVTLAFAPRQCIGCPWEAPGAGDELAALGVWIESLGGVVYAAKIERWSINVCEACGCPRGYTIIVTLSGDDAINILHLQGFGFAPVP